MSVLEIVGLLSVVLVGVSGGVIWFNHYKFKQWLKDEWKAGRRQDGTGN
jgi:hypothetical protein